MVTTPTMGEPNKFSVLAKRLKTGIKRQVWGRSSQAGIKRFTSGDVKANSSTGRIQVDVSRLLQSKDVKKRIKHIAEVLASGKNTRKSA